MSIYKTIVVTGKSGVGKTSSLLSFVARLKEHFDYSGEKYSLSVLDYSEKRKTNDKIAVFQVRNKKIGICTRGDAESMINFGLGKLKGCDYFICAAHLFGDTLNPFIKCGLGLFSKEECIFLNKTGLHGDHLDVNNDTDKKLIEIDNNGFANLVLDIFLSIVYR